MLATKVSCTLSCAQQMVYVVLMYFEFGIGTWLDERPLLYGLSHQVRYLFGLGTSIVSSSGYYCQYGVTRVTSIF